VSCLQGIRNAFTKVQAVNGDLSLPGMGMSDEDAAAVLQQVTTVIHCAADIELDAPIHKTLK
jgi:thioester reductase-like protein